MNTLYERALKNTEYERKDVAWLVNYGSFNIYGMFPIQTFSLK